MPTSIFAECTKDAECEAIYKPGSKCRETGLCSNPYSAGCLYYMYTHTDRQLGAPTASHSKRTCNSKDATTEDCEQPTLPYPEIRVHNADWETAIMYSWIIQILLSEFLQVPTTVGMNNDDTPQASFYAPDMPLSYSSKAYAWEELVTANEMGGRCELTDKDCVHVLPEVWTGQEKRWGEYLDKGHIDQVSWDGQVGKLSWYIPFHTTEKYPALTSVYGLTGQREKLASIFNRPTSWGEYCKVYSPTNCTTDDGVAGRIPLYEDEDAKYFQDGWYTGFFRPTTKNDCSLNPETCSGHIVAPSCTWDTNLDAQTYWNDISLESDGPLPENNGYTYGQMIDIWRAANATQSHVVMWWWTPDATVEEFRGTRYQFQPIFLPESTHECNAARIQPEDRCSLDPVTRRGPKGGGCEDEAEALRTVVASSLRDLTYDTPEVDRSPGYQAILNLKVSKVDLNMMLQQWVAGGRSGFTAREAVCEWVIDHQEDLELFIPRGYPRVVVDTATYSGPLLYVAIGCGGVAILYVLVAAFMVYKYSASKVFVYAQVPFVFLVLFGIFLVACGSIFVALVPQDPVCVTQKWFITLGYTLELVPLLVKIAAINRVVAATRRMKRVRISMQSLCLTVVALVVAVVLFMTIWTVVDPPMRHEDRYLKDVDVVATAIVCASNSALWDMMALCWNGILILCATVLAFQSRNVKEEFNDSQSLGTMIYSHFVFAVLRVVAFGLNGAQDSDAENGGGYSSISASTLAGGSSFLLSLDVIIAVTIYVVPKLDSARKHPDSHDTSSAIMTNDMDIRSDGHPGMTPTKSAMKKSIADISMPPSSRSQTDNFGRDAPSNGDGRLDKIQRSTLSARRFPSGPLSILKNSSASGDMCRVGIEGGDEDEDISLSSDEADLGGPRFAALAGALRSGSSKTTIHCIEEGLDESSRSM